MHATGDDIRLLVLAEVVPNLGGKGESELKLFNNDDHRLEKSKGEACQILCKSIMDDAGVELEAGKLYLEGGIW